MLNEKQWLELYTSSLENRKDIVYIKETLDGDQMDIKECQVKMNALEVDQSFKKGKVAYLAVSVTALFTILVNGVLWAFNSIGGK